jgi:hypothetical protein
MAMMRAIGGGILLGIALGLGAAPAFGWLVKLLGPREARANG